MDDILTSDSEQGKKAELKAPEARFNLQQRHYDLARAEQAVHRSRGRHMTVEDILRRNGFRLEEDAEKSAAKMMGQRSDLNMQALRIYVPTSVQTAMGICLLELKDGVLRVAAGDTVEENDLERLIMALRRGKCQIEKVDVEAWDRAELARLMREQTEIASERLVRIFAGLSRDSDNASLVEQAVYDILAEALQSRTSDIHLTLQDDDVRCWVRYRVDGDLVYKHLLPNRVMAPIITRIKTDAKMDAADRQHPQDGRLTFDWQGRMIDVRVASLPVAPSGEKITMRLLDRDNLRSFEELFSNADQVAGRLRRVIHGHVKDGGLIVVSGPTGSGKSTTLYGIIQEIDRTAKAVYSVEAPVEYDMPLVDQTSVTDHSGMTIASAIRALMRHDPDVIIIGEMRDGDTVEAALRATESGHLVITTVHAVNALHVIDRIDGFLSSTYRTSGLYILGHALIGSLSQRLVKTVCPACHRQVPAPEVYNDGTRYEDLGLKADDKVAVANRKGCDLCNHSGFLGRTLALEALFPPEDQASKRSITEMILSNVTNSIADIPGTVYIPREQTIKDLIRRRVIDAYMGLGLLVEEMAAKTGGGRQ
jgi:type II secretory ATPase GspE/PulE/Tfp pilus assembly ATPase PilB-like protein